MMFQKQLISQPSSSVVSQLHHNLPANRGKLIASLFTLALMLNGLGTIAFGQTAHFGGAQTTVGSGFAYPAATALDASGNLYVVDSAHNVIKEILAVNGSIPVFPTTRTLGGVFNRPVAVAVDGNGNVYVANDGDGSVKQMLAVNGSIPDSPAILTLTELAQPQGLAVDASGNLYVSGGCQGPVPPGMLCGFVEEILAVNGTVTPQSNSITLPISPSSPGGLAVDRSGNVYVADSVNNQVAEILAVNGAVTINSSSRILVSLVGAGGVAVDASGNVFISQPAANNVTEVLAVNGSVPNPVTTNLIKTLGMGFHFPAGISADTNGNLYVADVLNNRIVKISPSIGNFGSVNVGTEASAIPLVFIFDASTTLGSTSVLTKGAVGIDFTDAGSDTCTANTAYTAGQACTISVNFSPTVSGFRLGAVVFKDSTGGPIATGNVQGLGLGPQVNFLPGIQSTVLKLNASFAIAVDGSNDVYVADSNSGAVYKEVPSAGGYTQQGPIGVNLRSALGLSVDASGNLYIVDASADVVYKETPSPAGYTQSVVSTLNGPRGVAVDGTGNLYILAIANNSAYCVKETPIAGGYIQTTIPTSGTSLPGGFAVDGNGNVYISDTYNGRVIKETATAGGYIQSNVASGLGQPDQIAVDGNGNVYIADSQHSVVLQETWTGSGYTESTLADYRTGILYPYGVALDGSGNVYIGESSSVLKLDLADAPSLTFPNTVYGSTSSPQTITIENIGNASLIFPIPSTGNNPSIAANFTLDSSSTLACPMTTAGSSTVGTLAADASCQLPISFVPATPGVASGSLVLIDNNLNAAGPGYAVQTIALNGIGMQAPIVTWATPTPISYGTPMSSTQLNATSTVAGTFAYSPALGTVLTAGSQTLTATFTPTDSTDYTTVLATVTLTVYQAPSTITWPTPAAIAYGTPLSATQLNASSTVAGSFSYSPTTGAVLTAGAQTLTTTFTPTDTADYAPATGTVTVTVNQAAPAITWATPAPITYGTVLSATQLNASSTVAGNFVFSPAAGTLPTAGTQTLTTTFTPTDTVDYSSATTNVTLTVNQATPAITWAAPSAITYGTVLSATQLNASSTVAGTFTYSPAAGTTLGAGSQAVTATFTPADTVDYSTTTASVAITVNPMTPAITWAAPTAIPYGTALSATQLYASSTVPGTITYSPPAGTVLNAGAQTLTATFAPTNSTNYTTAAASVILTVNQAATVLIWPTPAAITYGTTLSATQLNASSTVTGTFTYSPATGTLLNAGTQTLTATFTPSNPTDYTSTTATVTLAVNKATPAITWPTPAAITQGTALSATQLDATSTVAGSFAYSPAAGTVLSAGSQTLTTTFTPTNTANYSAATGSVVLTVNPAPSFTLSASPTSLSVAQGASGTSTIALTPKNGFSSSATLSATGLPSGVTASFSTNPTTGTSVLTLTASSTATVGTTTVTVTAISGNLTASTTVTLTVTAKAGFACHIGYTISNQWPGGFGAAITINNTGSTSISSWTLTWIFANGQTITQLWSGTETQSGTTVTVNSLSYNGSIPAGGSYTGMGFNGTWNNKTNAAPTSFAVNGTACK